MLFEPFNSVVEGLEVYESDNSSNQQTLLDTHTDVVKQRSSMDMKLTELNHQKNTIYQENKQRYDRTMFGGIVLSILGASLGYYIIRHN